MIVSEMIESLEKDLCLTREEMAVTAGVVYYKIMFVYRNNLCTIVRAHDGCDMRFMIGTMDCGSLYEYFVSCCLVLPADYERW